MRWPKNGRRLVRREFHGLVLDSVTLISLTMVFFGGIDNDIWSYSVVCDLLYPLVIAFKHLMSL